MRGCLRAFMIMLILVAITALGLGFFFTINGNPNPTSGDVFEMVVYGCSFIVCLFLFVELCKWKGRF